MERKGNDGMRKLDGYRVGVLCQSLLLLIIISNILLEQILYLSMSVGCWFVINTRSFSNSYKDTFFVEI
jgi:hypothetical protein